MWLIAQAGEAAGTVNLIGQMLIALVVLGGIYAIYAYLIAPKLPPQVTTVVNIILGVIAAIVAIKILLSLL